MEFHMKNAIRKICAVVLIVAALAGWVVIPTPAQAAFFGAEAGATEANLPSSVTLNVGKTVRLAVGEQLTLTPTLTPAASQSAFTWKSSKKKVATVSDGVVTAKRVGTAKITVTTQNRKKASVKIKVYDPARPTSVSLKPKGTRTFYVGDVLQLTATLHPETAQSALKWKSSKKKVARVDANGTVTALRPGKATITVTTRNKKKARIKIKVLAESNQPIATTVGKSSAATDKKKDTQSTKDPQNVISGIQGVELADPVPEEETSPVEYLPIMPPEGYNLPYVIYACKDSHTIAIIARDDNGDWTRVLRLFPTGMGRNNATDVGSFTITKKERWHEWTSGYSPYANKLSIGIFLHGPIYKDKNQNTIRTSYYNVIGTDCSSGCLRTTCACAAWVYYNCPLGTYVIIAQDGRFSTDPPAKIKKSATSDPTDPGFNYEILITGFDVVPGVVTLPLGMSQPVTPVNISPSNASTRHFKYYISDPSVATVSSDGLVTAVGYGGCLVLITAADDYKCTVSVPVIVDPPAMYEAAADDEALPDEVVQSVEQDDQTDDYDAFIVEETPIEAESPVVVDIDSDEGSSDEEGCERSEAPDETNVPEEASPVEENGNSEETVFMNMDIREVSENQSEEREVEEERFDFVDSTGDDKVP